MTCISRKARHTVVASISRGKERTKVQLLDVMFPLIRIDLVYVRSIFGPQVLRTLSAAWDVPVSHMFICCPTSEEEGRRLQNLTCNGLGVRIIMAHEEEDLVEDVQLFVSAKGSDGSPRYSRAFTFSQ